jgi:hypothetical protein
MGRLGWFIPALMTAMACAPVAPGHERAEPSTGELSLCQPFPDRLVDGLQGAYNRQDLKALRRLVRVPQITDALGAAHAGRIEFDDVAD